MSDDDHPGIVQHGHHLANGCSLVERIDAGRPEGFDAPPQRRWRLVLDLGGDDIADLRQALDEIDRALHGRQIGSGALLLGSTSGSPTQGYHWELIERDVDHETFIAELMAWRERRRAAA